MLIHKTAFTAGITKKGEIKRTRTMPCPGNDLLINTAMQNAKDHGQEENAAYNKQAVLDRKQESLWIYDKLRSCQNHASY